MSTIETDKTEDNKKKPLLLDNVKKLWQEHSKLREYVKDGAVAIGLFIVAYIVKKVPLKVSFIGAAIGTYLISKDKGTKDFIRDRAERVVATVKGLFTEERKEEKIVRAAEEVDESVNDLATATAEHANEEVGPERS